MRRLRNGWEIMGAVSICCALASVFMYLAYLMGWYQEPTPADAIVAMSLALVSLILFVIDAPD